MKGMTIKAMTAVCNGTYYGDKQFFEKEVSAITTINNTEDMH